MPDKLNFDNFEPAGEAGGDEFVRHARDMGLWGAVLWPSMRRGEAVGPEPANAGGRPRAEQTSLMGTLGEPEDSHE